MGLEDIRCKNFNVVIDCPNTWTPTKFSQSITLLCDKLSANGYTYAMIYHDKDTKINGDLKTLHYHFVILAEKICRLSTMLYRIADYMSIAENCIQIDKCNNVAKSIQYLTHKNNADKFQYDIKDVVSNLSSLDLTEYYCEESTLNITTEYLYDLVRAGKSNIEIMFIIGVGRYHIFKNAIQDIRFALDREGIEYLDKIREYSNK